jgi:hypothetical protein
MSAPWDGVSAVLGKEIMADFGLEYLADFYLPKKVNLQ